MYSAPAAISLLVYISYAVRFEDKMFVVESYLCLFTYIGVQHILCCVFSLFFVVLCTICCQFLWIVHSVLSNFYLLTLMFFYRTSREPTKKLPIILPYHNLIVQAVFDKKKLK
jgi:hypothetical protein